MKRILIPTDFSEQADNAFKVAIQLAKTHDCELYVLHSMDLPSHLAIKGNTSSLPESLYFIKLAEKQFSDLHQRPYLKGVEFNEAIGHGQIYEDIQEACTANKIDLIVMGSSGASGLKEMFVGSNTEKVVRTSNTPVLVIKNNHKNFNVKDFVFATDFSEECEKPFKLALDFAQFLGAKIHLLYVNTPSNFKSSLDTRNLMKKFVNGMAEDSYSLNVFNDSSVEKGILNFAKDINAQLIGMSTHGRQGLAHLFNGSISEDMVNHANMPVVTFKI